MFSAIANLRPRIYTKNLANFSDLEARDGALLLLLAHKIWVAHNAHTSHCYASPKNGISHTRI